MASERAHTLHPAGTSHVDGSRAAVNQALVLVAERELKRALAEQERPSLGMYVHPSQAEAAAFGRAVDVICREAHCLELRAEELLIGIKQAWTQLAAVRARHLGERDGDVLREVVSSSIEVFFESREIPGEARH
jgi:hypothetical protein